MTTKQPHLASGPWEVFVEIDGQSIRVAGGAGADIAKVTEQALELRRQTIRAIQGTP